MVLPGEQVFAASFVRDPHRGDLRQVRDKGFEQTVERLRTQVVEQPQLGPALRRVQRRRHRLEKATDPRFSEIQSLYDNRARQRRDELARAVERNGGDTRGHQHYDEHQISQKALAD